MNGSVLQRTSFEAGVEAGCCEPSMQRNKGAGGIAHEKARP